MPDLGVLSTVAPWLELDAQYFYFLGLISPHVGWPVAVAIGKVVRPTD